MAAMGTTPGQQLAQFGMVTPAEVSRARRDAEEMGLKTGGLKGADLARVVKAERHAIALGISRAEAYAGMTKAVVELMPYVHQRQAPASEDKTKAPATVFMLPEGAAMDAQQLLDFSATDDGEGFEIIEQMPMGGQSVGNGQSDDTP